MTKNIFRWTAISILFYTILSISSWLDPRELIYFNIFPWDSGVYKHLADQFLMGQYSNLNAMYPFGVRVLFPLLFSNITKYLDLDLALSAYILNILSTYFLTLLIEKLWRGFRIPFVLRFLGICLFLLLFNGPLRQAGIYPGGSLAFDSLLVLLTYFTIKNCLLKRIAYTPYFGLIIFTASLAREFIFYILLLLLFAIICLKKFCQNHNSPFYFLNANSNSYSIHKLLILFSFSFISSLLTRLLVHDSDGSYSLLNVILYHGWLHLHIGELLYIPFVTLGPFFLAFLVAMSLPASRALLFKNLLSINSELLLFITFCVAGIFFMLFAGTDSDRFLLWFFPFYGYLGLASANSLIRLHNLRINYSICLIAISGIFWTRCYVPAAPHLFFPGEMYGAQAGVKTNYDPELFYGPKFLEKYRLPLKPIDRADTFQNVYVDKDWEKRMQSTPMVSAEISRNTVFTDPPKPVYANNINNIPFPLGFAHNQYEILIAHPTHGDKKIRAAILLQWLLIFGSIMIINRKLLRNR